MNLIQQLTTTITLKLSGLAFKQFTSQFKNTEGHGKTDVYKRQGINKKTCYECRKGKSLG